MQHLLTTVGIAFLAMGGLTVLVGVALENNGVCIVGAGEIVYGAVCLDLRKTRIH